ncbi:hypothetical protein NYA22BAC_02766 [Parasphingorhabdus sp. NYA22]
MILLCGAENYQQVRHSHVSLIFAYDADRS